MDLFEAHAKGLPIVLETGEGGDRLAAEIFKTGRGIVFADVGWPGATWHPFHAIEGELGEGKYDWKVGAVEIRIAFQGEELFDSWKEWQAWRSSGAGAAFGRDRAWAEIQRSGILEPAAA